MACDSIRQPNQTPVQRVSEIKEALARLEGFLKAGTVRITIAPNGAVAFTGWIGAERRNVSDVCAVRTLTARNSWELRQAIARAEASSGRRVNYQAVAAGTHSHDGGKTWHKGH